MSTSHVKPIINRCTNFLFTPFRSWRSSPQEIYFQAWNNHEPVKSGLKEIRRENLLDQELERIQSVERRKTKSRQEPRWNHTEGSQSTFLKQHWLNLYTHHIMTDCLPCTQFTIHRTPKIGISLWRIQILLTEIRIWRRDWNGVGRRIWLRCIQPANSIFKRVYDISNPISATLSLLISEVEKRKGRFVEIYLTCQLTNQRISKLEISVFLRIQTLLIGSKVEKKTKKKDWLKFIQSAKLILTLNPQTWIRFNQTFPNFPPKLKRRGGISQRISNSSTHNQGSNSNSLDWDQKLKKGLKGRLIERFEWGIFNPSTHNPKNFENRNEWISNPNSLHRDQKLKKKM